MEIEGTFTLGDEKMPRKYKISVASFSRANKAVAYIRLSKEELQEGVNLDAQEDQIRTYCTLNGLELLTVFRDEYISAGTALDKRPQGAAMLKAIVHGDATNVVAVRPDRLFRNAVECLAYLEKWDTSRVWVHFLDLSVNTGSSKGKMFLRIAEEFAQMERNLLRERTKNTLAQKKANLQVYNHVPYGFNREGNSLVRNDGEQAIIDRIKAMNYAGVPMLRIAETLNTEGVPTKREGKWHASTVKAILTNTLHGTV